VGQAAAVLLTEALRWSNAGCSSERACCAVPNNVLSMCCCCPAAVGEEDEAWSLLLSWHSRLRVRGEPAERGEAGAVLLQLTVDGGGAGMTPAGGGGGDAAAVA
jgi:hypothetical protein